MSYRIQRLKELMTHDMATGNPVCRDRIQEYCTVLDTENTIYIQWHSEDVRLRAQDNTIALGDDDARQILHDIANTHQADTGINWDVLDAAIENFMKDKGYMSQACPHCDRLVKMSPQRMSVCPHCRETISLL